MATIIISCGDGVLVSFAKRHFWWPTRYSDVKEFVLACSTCAQNKSLHQPPVGLLHPSPFLVALGPTSLWIALLVCPLQKVTPPYLPLSTDSLKLCILSLWLNFPQQWKQHNSWFSMFFDSTAFPVTSSLNVGPSLCLRFGEHSVKHSVLL